MLRDNLRGLYILILIIAAALTPLLSIAPDIEDGIGPMAKDGSASGGSVGPAADTTPPKFISFKRAPGYPGPTTPVNLSVTCSDASAPINISARYGFDNSTWTNISTQTTYGKRTFTDRKPTSGYGYNTVLSGEYDLDGRDLAYLNVYIYSADHDTCYIRVRGWDSVNSLWDTILSVSGTSTAHKDGTMVNGNFLGEHYTKFDVRYYDTENNDNIYYNVTYTTHDPVHFDIPAAGSNTKVYVRLKAADPSDNTRVHVYEYPVDSTAPTVRDVTAYTTTVQSVGPIEIYANVTDNRRVARGFINWSLDEVNWSLSPMSYSSGIDSAKELKGLLPPPNINENQTVYYRVEGYDEGDNRGNSTTCNLTWNTPPWFSGLTHDPFYVNNRTTVNLTATVTDSDNITRVWVRYYASGIPWTEVNASRGAGDAWHAIIPAIKGSPYVYYRFHANDSEGGTNNTTTVSYEIDEVNPYVGAQGRDLLFADPDQAVDVVGTVVDKNPVANVTLQYSTDMTNWTNLSTTQGSGLATFQERNPSSGFTSGTTITRTYNLYGRLEHLYVYCYSSDSTTLYVLIRGYDSDTGAWDNLYYQYSASPGSEVKLDASFPTKEYTRWSITYYDYEYDDNIYYNARWTVTQTGHWATVPAMGTGVSTVHYRFNMTDAANNTNTSEVYSFSIDSKGPVVTDHSLPSGLWNDTSDLMVYADVTDDHFVREVYLNYSKDGVNWVQVRMSTLADQVSSGRYMAILPYPRPTENVTLRVYIDAYDYPYNKGNSTLHTFSWNPPPWISDVSIDPLHPNNSTTVDVTSDVWDDDAVSRVWVMYSFDSQSSWNVTDATAGTGTSWTATVPAVGGISYVHYYVLAQDSDGNRNYTVTMSYFIDEDPPGLGSPSIDPVYPNATVPVTVKMAANDKVGLDTVKLQYRFGSSGAFTDVLMSKTSGPTSSNVGGAMRYNYATYFAGLQDMGPRLGDWDSSVSTYGVNPKAALFTDMDIILLDGYGASWYYNEGLTAASNGKFVIMNQANWNSARSSAGNPSYTTYTSNGFTTYIFKQGSGLVVYTYNLYNRNYLGYSYWYYKQYMSETYLVDLAEHLLEIRATMTVYVGQVPATSTTSRVEYRVQATDVSNLTTTSGIYNYYTDGDDPVVTDAGGPPSPPLVWFDDTHPVWVKITDETFLHGVKLVYSFDNGSTWQTRDLSRTSGDDTAATYSGEVPPMYIEGWVWYHYEALDRAMNWMRYPSGSEYQYRTTDIPNVANVYASPMHAGASSVVTITADVTDDDGVSSVDLLYRVDAGATSTVGMTPGAGDRWSATITSPGYTARVYFFLRMTDNLGMVVDSTDRYLIVDNDTPTIGIAGLTPEYPNATGNTIVNAIAHDPTTSLDIFVDYRYGSGGTVQTGLAGKGGQIEVVDQVPASGTTTTTLSQDYYVPNGTVVGRVTLRVWSKDHDNCYVYLRGMKESGTWETIYLSSSTTDGIKVDRSVEQSGYVQLNVSYHDVDRDPFYYNLTYTYIGTDIDATVPPPGYTTTVYYRIRVVDEVGLSSSSAWGSYHADGYDPLVIAHKTLGVMDCAASVDLAVTLRDETRMGRAQVFYSCGRSPYKFLNMTNTFFNGTHLGATVTLNKTRIPMTVSYYFVFWDAANNMNTSKVYTYRTKMRDLVEGVYNVFDSSVLTSTAPYIVWEWDFDYNGSVLDVERTGQITRHRFVDNGTYTVGLRLTDLGGNTSMITFSLVVLDASPLAVIKEVDDIMEGGTVTLDAEWSSSWPDAIVSYEWDLGYDGSTFDVDATGVTHNYTIENNGTYRIALRVTDDDGSTAITDISLTVIDGKPILVVSYPNSWDEGSQLSLNASASTSWPDALDRIEWDMDYDGSFDIDLTGILVNHTYMDDGTYQWMARAFDDDGSVTQFQGAITVHDLSPEAKISTNGRVEEGKPLDFDGNLSASFPDTISLYDWDFAYDGTFDPMATGVAANHTYMDDGTYTVALRVTDDDGSTHIATAGVTVDDLSPSPAMSSLSTVDEGTAFDLTSIATSFPDLITKEEWDFEYDGTTFTPDAEGTGVEHTYFDNGTYLVALRVVDDDGSVEIVTHEILVNDLGPTADLIIGGEYQEGKTLLLDARGSASFPDDIVSYEWDVDYDGSGFDVDLEGPIVEHAYLDDGTYTVAFRVTDDDGTQEVAVQTIEVTDLGPHAVVTLGQNIHAEGTLVVFNAGSSTSSPDELVAYHWDWEGDGEVDETTDEVNGRHVFTTPGRYDVTLTVEDDDGSTSTASVKVTISDVAPTAKLSADPTPEGQPVLLDASASQEPGNDFVAFRWDLNGDGSWDREETCSTLENIWYVPGTYSISVQVEDEDGSMASKSMTLLIDNVAPQVDAGGPYRVDEGTPLELDGSDTYEPGDHITTYRWDVDGDGRWDVEGMEPVITWTYVVAGTYQLRLQVEDEDGTNGEALVEVVVNDLEPLFTVVMPTDVRENVPANFTLDGLSDPGTGTFTVTWFFGDGQSAKGVSVQHAFPEQGTYRGRVTVADNDGGVVDRRWVSAIEVANSPPVVELSDETLKAVEDSVFSLTVHGLDTANDTVTYSVKGAGGKIDPTTGLFTWTPLDEHVPRTKMTFIATDEDGGEGTLEVDIDVKDVDNDFLGMSTAAGLGLVAVMILVVLVAVLLVARQRGIIGGKDGQDIIESEDKVDLRTEVEVDLDSEKAGAAEAEAAAAAAAAFGVGDEPEPAPKTGPAPDARPPAPATRPPERVPAERPPTKRKGPPPLGPDGQPMKRRPPPLGPDGKPMRRRPPPLGPDGKPMRRRRRPPPEEPTG